MSIRPPIFLEERRILSFSLSLLPPFSLPDVGDSVRYGGTAATRAHTYYMYHRLTQPLLLVDIFYSCNSASETRYGRVANICSASRTSSRLSAHKERKRGGQTRVRPKFRRNKGKDRERDVNREDRPCPGTPFIFSSCTFVLSPTFIRFESRPSSEKHRREKTRARVL